jgi:hypothetical protein
MKPGTRTIVSLFPLVLQGGAALFAVQVISFFMPGVVSFLKAHEGKITVPRVTHLLVGHVTAAKMVILGLFAVSVITLLFTRSKMRDEVDRLAVQSAIYSAIWLIGVIYFGGILMAAALPYFALNSQ